jgi:AcrR family transcriptional regulator
MKPGATQALNAEELGNTGDAILEAAIELFAEPGYNATSMREIAASVAMRAAGMCHWYESKEAILITLQDGFLSDLTAKVVAAIDRQR